MLNRLKVIRAEQNLTQTELAKMAEISRSTLSQIENGEIDPSFETIAKLVKVLQVPANRIFSALDVVS